MEHPADLTDMVRFLGALRRKAREPRAAAVQVRRAVPDALMSWAPAPDADSLLEYLTSSSMLNTILLIMILFLLLRPSLPIRLV